MCPTPAGNQVSIKCTGLLAKNVDFLSNKKISANKNVQHQCLNPAISGRLHEPKRINVRGRSNKEYVNSSPIFNSNQQLIKKISKQ